MEPGQTVNFNEKFNRIINNRNLKEHSCFIGVKTLKVLKLNPKNADAYNYLAEKEKNITKAIELYEKAIVLAKETMGTDAFKEYKGYFWGILETRPYMRAKEGLAGCFVSNGELERSIKIYKEMLELNPNDNQGVIYALSTLCLKTNNFDEFEKLDKEFSEDGSAVSKFNKTLFQFKKEGETIEANKLLLEAHNQNNYVIDLLLGNIEMPKKQPNQIGLGDKNEAVAYVSYNYSLWEDSENAFEWIYN